MATDGGRILAGAHLEDIPPATTDRDVGAAYLFSQNSQGQWRTPTRLVAPGGIKFDYFGFAVAIDGDVALIGAHQDDGGAVSGQGAVHVFQRSSSGAWNHQTELFAARPTNYHSFGYSVALDSNRALIGAYRDDDLSNNSGAAYVFE